MDPPQRSHSRGMRTTPTEAERKLWWHPRHRLPLSGSHFRRQVQIGPFIADFVCHQSKLIIELDGGQHASQTRKDDTRTSRLQSEGYRVLRFWNNEILGNTEGVVLAILEALRG